MRRGTLIAVIALAVLLLGTAILQFTMDAPSAPFPGPESGTPLPSGLTTVPPS
jgi:hypothetical protein